MGSSALALAATQLIYVLIDSAILMQTAELRWREVVGANFFLAGAAAAIAGLFIAWMVLYKEKLSCGRYWPSGSRHPQRLFDDEPRIGSHGESAHPGIFHVGPPRGHGSLDWRASLPRHYSGTVYD